MSIELLWWEGCPSTEKALATLRDVMREEGLDPDAVELREVRTDDDAERERFVGSPTIRVDGVEVAPAEREPTGLTCRVYRLRDGHVSPTAVVFTCNHCPYALAWHDRLLAVARDYEDRARVLMVNPNDAQRYPRDSFDAMKERVAADGGWPAPYLHDESQEVARGYGAEKTPDVFLLDADGRLRYRGAPDADYGDPSQDAAWLRAALDAVLDGREPEPAETPPVGCSVKWSQ